MGDRKPDADAIERIIDANCTAEWMPPVTRWWPNFLFHLTDVTNAARIIADGELLSRALAYETGRIAHDQGDRDVIGQTPREFHRNARLYFRPRNTTFFVTEGIRPLSERGSDAHCPVPVAFLFDARAVLSSSGVCFANQGTNRRSANPALGNDAHFLATEMPWETIYVGARREDLQTREAQLRTRAHQHAEVQIADRLSLSFLREIVVRSVAERETLLALLQEETGNITATPPAPILLADQRPRTFYGDRPHVLRVDGSSGMMTVEFNQAPENGPFMLDLEVWLPGVDAVAHRIQKPGFRAQRRVKLPLPPDLPSPFYVRLRLDNAVAYQGLVTPWVQQSLII